ncbi:MAG: hypothetical protein RR758_00300 [Burkholderiaceae bacterium]
MKRTDYLICMLVSALIAIGAAAFFSYAMDPYALFRPEQGARPVFEADIAQMKLYQAVARHADAVVLGNSRADIGFDPRHPFIAKAGRAAHNLATPGGGIEISAAQLEALCRIVPVRRAILGVDFIDFIRLSNKSPEHFADRPLRTEPSMLQFARALVSAEAVADSVRVAWGLGSSSVSRQTLEGLNLLNAYEKEATRAGYFSFFQQRLEENAKRSAAGRWALVGPDESARVALGRLIATSARCGTELIVVTYPYHLQYLTLIKEAGLWSDFEAWKRMLVAALDGEPAGKHLRLVDFATVTSFTSEHVPDRGEADYTPQFYWEAGHFKRELGDRLLDALEQDDPASVGGVALDASGVDAHLHAEQAALARAVAADIPLAENVAKVWRTLGQGR